MKTLAAHHHPVVVKEKTAPAQAEQKGSENAGTVPDTPAAVAGEVSQGFAGMVIRGTAYEDREAAGTALLEASKKVKDTDPVEIGSYWGFTMLVEPGVFHNDLILKGAMTHKAELGIDPRGKLIRIDHALEKMPERLEAVKVYLNNLFEQQDAAKAKAGLTLAI